jgi:hypothetical protein
MLEYVKKRILVALLDHVYYVKKILEYEWAKDLRSNSRTNSNVWKGLRKKNLGILEEERLLILLFLAYSASVQRYKIY